MPAKELRLHNVENGIASETMPRSPDQFKVAIIGNSNSIAVTSYAHILRAYADLDIKNYSIGGVPNIILLNLLTNPEANLAKVDVIIVELAVIEAIHLKPGAVYKPEHSREIIDLFMNALRSCTAAKVIFLILPTIFALLEPQRSLAETHYTHCARRHGAAVLNGYNILRNLGALDSNGPPPDFMSKVDRFVAAFGLPGREVAALRLLMRQSAGELHGAQIGTKAFCGHAFDDNIHVSRMFHEMTARLLYDWMCHLSLRNQSNDIGRKSQEVVIGCDPLPVGNVDHVERTNSSMSRRLLSLRQGDTVVYRCPPEYYVASILLNASRTSAFLNFTSPLGSASVDARFQEQPSEWVAAVARVPETLDDEVSRDVVGGGDIHMIVSNASMRSERPNYFRSLDTGTNPARSVAEIGEVVLVRRDWRDLSAGAPVSENGQFGKNIEEQDWAVGFISRFATTGARAVAGTARSNVIVQRSTFLNLLSRTFGESDEASRDACRASFLVAADEFEGAHSAIARGLEKSPDHALLLAMRQALADLKL
jgi:hypothetical protein